MARTIVDSREIKIKTSIDNSTGHPDRFVYTAAASPKPEPKSSELSAGSTFPAIITIEMIPWRVTHGRSSQTNIRYRWSEDCENQESSLPLDDTVRSVDPMGACVTKASILRFLATAWFERGLYLCRRKLIPKLRGGEHGQESVCLGPYCSYSKRRTTGTHAPAPLKKA